MKAVGKFDTEDEYGIRVQLDDGQFANVVSCFTGPGLGCDTEIEANRKLTKEEIQSAFNLQFEYLDDEVPRMRMPTMYRF